MTLPDNMRVNRIYSALAVQRVNRDNASAKSGCLWEGTSQLQDALGAVGPWKRRHPPKLGPLHIRWLHLVRALPNLTQADGRVESATSEDGSLERRGSRLVRGRHLSLMCQLPNRL